MAAVAAVGTCMALSAPAYGVSKNVTHVGQLPELANATAINFLKYGPAGQGKGHAFGRSDVMLVTGRFGLKSYSLTRPDKPRLLDEITAEELRLPGDPAVDFSPGADGLTPRSTFWQNEDMDVDRERKLVILSRDPRAYGGTTAGEPRNPLNPADGTPLNVAGFYVVDAQNPNKLKLLTFQQLPGGHTTTCINGCQWLWTGGPAATASQQAMGWAGRPLWATDLTDPSNPVAYPDQPLDLGRRDGTTAYSHDVQVDNAGIAWVSGDGGTRGYWTSGTHVDPLTGQSREATPLNPIPYGGGGLPQTVTADTTGGFEHNAWRPVGESGLSDQRYKDGKLLLATEEDFGPTDPNNPDRSAQNQCRDRGKFTISSLEGSFNGEAWKSTPQNPFRLQVVGQWDPFEEAGSRNPAGPFHPMARFCSAHYFDVDGSIVTYAWYGEGTRFLDISNPANPVQIAYWRPDDTVVWASYMHTNGYIYTADRVRGVDILQLTPGASAARRANRGVRAPAMGRRQVRFLKRLSRQYKADPGTGGLCLLAR